MMQITPAHPLSKFIKGIELDGQAINALFVDLDTGRCQYWENGKQVSATGQVRILLESHAAEVALEPSMAVELDQLLDRVKRKMATMTPEDRQQAFEEQKRAFVEGLTKDLDLGST